MAIFQLSPDGKSLHYQLDLTEMNAVIGAHIHRGKQGENGPMLAGLFNADMSGPPTAVYIITMTLLFLFFQFSC